MSHPSTPEEIRAETFQCILEALANRCRHNGPWSQQLDACADCHQLATDAVEGLAAAGMLVTAVEGRYIGRGLLRRTRYVTDWREPEEANRD